MLHFPFSALRTLIALGSILVIGTAAYAYAEGNSISDTHAGDGQGQISGYTVSSVHLSLDPEDPSGLNYVTFTLDAPASTVKLQLEDGGTFFECADIGLNTWKCITPEQRIGSLTRLRVIAVGQ